MAQCGVRGNTVHLVQLSLLQFARVPAYAQPLQSPCGCVMRTFTNGDFKEFVMECDNGFEVNKYF